VFDILRDIDFVTLTIICSCFIAYTLKYILFLKCIYIYIYIYIYIFVNIPDLCPQTFIYAYTIAFVGMLSIFNRFLYIGLLLQQFRT
jgi:hypothetical protein